MMSKPDKKKWKEGSGEKTQHNNKSPHDKN